MGNLQWPHPHTPSSHQLPVALQLWVEPHGPLLAMLEYWLDLSAGSHSCCELVSVMAMSCQKAAWCVQHSSQSFRSFILPTALPHCDLSCGRGCWHKRSYSELDIKPSFTLSNLISYESCADCWPLHKGTSLTRVMSSTDPRYKHRYLEGSSKMYPFSKAAVVGSPSEPMNSTAMGIWPVLQYHT